MEKIRFAGLVMAGGKSVRMGRDKALLRLGGGPSLLEAACGKIASLTPYWHVSCAKGAPRDPCPCLEDELEGCGPLAGVLKGLQNALEHDFQALIILACDMPLLPPEILRALMRSHARAKPAPLLTVYQNARSGFLEMQAAVYGVKALPFFQDAAKHGQRRLSAVIPEEFQQRLPHPPGHEHFFLNCNSPEDLDLAEKFLRLQTK